MRLRLRLGGGGGGRAGTRWWVPARVRGEASPLIVIAWRLGSGWGRGASSFTLLGHVPRPRSSATFLALSSIILECRLCGLRRSGDRTAMATTTTTSCVGTSPAETEPRLQTNGITSRLGCRVNNGYAKSQTLNRQPRVRSAFSSRVCVFTCSCVRVFVCSWVGTCVSAPSDPHSLSLSFFKRVCSRPPPSILVPYLHGLQAHLRLWHGGPRATSSAPSH
jgi:hypothetical protein